jgi:probable HAF family extracellular repeat protein
MNGKLLKKNHGLAALATLALFMPVIATPSTAASQYTITDLGPIFISPYGHRIGAFGLNNLGQVVGGASVGGSSHAVLWQAGSTTPTDLGTLGGDSYAQGINDAGQVVGRYGDPFNSGNSNAFIWDAVNGMHELLPLPGNSVGNAGSINAKGQAVGESSNYSGDPYSHAVLWPAGSITPVDLGTLPGVTYSDATIPQASINRVGQVVGVSGNLGLLHAFLWTPAVANGTSGSMVDLGTFGGAQSGARSINASGIVGGEAQTASGNFHVFLWTPNAPNATSGVMADLGTLDGTDAHAYGINDAGQLVGFGYAAGVEHAFIYSGGVMTDLNSLIPPGSGWVFYRAFSINNNGQIVGYGTIGGQIHSFLLTPAPTYNVCLLYDPTKAVKSGSTIPIKLQLCDGNGNDSSSSSITVHAVSITQVSTSISGAVQDSGNANPDNDFRFDSTLGPTGGYIFNLKTNGLTTGTYNLNFTVTGDSFVYSTAFQVK